MKIKAFFKKATVAGGVANLQLDIDTDEPDAFDAIQLAGKRVIVDIKDEQTQINFDKETGECTYGID